MILAANQPYFIPYIGYFQLINAADVFVISDDYNYIDKEWVNRNRILVNKREWKFFNVEISHATSNKWINQLETALTPQTIAKKMRMLQMCYGKAPYYEAGRDLADRMLNCAEPNLALFLEHSIRLICDYLGIETKIVRSSDFPGNSGFKREYRVYDLCRRLGADTYYNAIGGTKLYSFDAFEAEGLKLGFLKSGNIVYRQFGADFVPSLSILDVIMFNDPGTIREMLADYSIIGRENAAITE